MTSKKKADKRKIDGNFKNMKDLSPITKNPDKSPSVSKKRATFIPSEVNFLSAQVNFLQVLQQEFESRNLPPIELKRFNGDPEQWPEFIENFY